MAVSANDVTGTLDEPTPFPTRPGDVAALTACEFACALDLHAALSIDDVCHRFVDDANRALVWLIRFRALTAWCDRPDTGPWLRAEPVRAERECAVAASFILNEHWEFDAGEFRSAVQSVAPRRRLVLGHKHKAEPDTHGDEHRCEYETCTACPLSLSELVLHLPFAPPCGVPLLHGRDK